jgi:hypothetical protein
MGQIAHHPESGLRIEVERQYDEGPPWCYQGKAVTPSSAYGVSAIVKGDGSVSVEVASEAPRRVADRVVRVMKAACVGLPHRIVQWRGER